MRYYIIAGEASGDLHGSNLMKGIYAEDSQAEIRFWGGDLMESVGGELVRHYKDGAIIGFVEVFVKARMLLGNVSFCKKDILDWKPDVVILIDYPGFNFKIAEFAHKAGFKVFYYIAPKVWASREGRIKKLKAYVDKLFIVFPFEIPYFTKKEVPFIYKGNPLVDAVDGSRAMNESRQDFLERNSLEDKPMIAMLAGSRKGEISTMMPVLTEFAAKMKAMPQYAGYQFVIGGAPARSMSDYEPWLTAENRQYIHVLFGETQSVIRHAEAAVVNSGTASLETVLFNTPQAVGYIGNPLTYLIAKRIVKIKYISLGNLIIDRLAFKEFIQDDCNSDALVNEIRELIENKDRRSAMLSDYAEIRNALGGSGASAAVAKAMLEELSSTR
ncbi:MAG: lipid-A-disaccharide synthase [Bacteroidales bacterium]|nr:lipid-A-disaccharide synthase [Bacteroidales bacterium]MBQ8811446.1 lipid-A-disaccharide synthase [Bacteroidales bacterium]